MQKIQLQGVQITDHYRLKQSGNMRITLELTASDSKLNAGVFGVCEFNEVLMDVELTPLDIQGENNGFALPDTTGMPTPKPPITGKNSMAKQLRDAIYRYWQQQASFEVDSETYYEKHMQALIDQYFLKLK